MTLVIVEASDHLKRIGYDTSCGPVYARVVDIGNAILRIVLPETSCYRKQTFLLPCNLIGSRWRVFTAAANAAA